MRCQLQKFQGHVLGTIIQQFAIFLIWHPNDISIIFCNPANRNFLVFPLLLENHQKSSSPSCAFVATFKLSESQRKIFWKSRKETCKWESVENLRNKTLKNKICKSTCKPNWSFMFFTIQRDLEQKGFFRECVKKTPQVSSAVAVKRVAFTEEHLPKGSHFWSRVINWGF